MTSLVVTFVACILISYLSGVVVGKELNDKA